MIERRLETPSEEEIKDTLRQMGYLSFVFYPWNKNLFIIFLITNLNNNYF